MYFDFLPFTKVSNVCFIKIRSKRNSNTLLSLLRFFMNQSLRKVTSDTEKNQTYLTLSSFLSYFYSIHIASFFQFCQFPVTCFSKKNQVFTNYPLPIN